MVFDNVFIRYLFILLLSIHLTASQSTSTEVISTDSTNANPPKTSTEQTTMNEHTMDTASIHPTTSDDFTNTSPSSSAEISESSASSVFDNSTSNTDTAILSTDTEETSAISSNTGTPTVILTASSPVTGGNPTAAASETIISNSPASVVTNTSPEETSVSDATGSSGSSATDKVFSPITATALVATRETEVSSISNSPITYYPNSEFTTEMSLFTDTTGPGISLASAQTSFIGISDGTEASVIMTGSTNSENPQQSTSSSAVSSDSIPPETSDSATVSMISSETISSATIYASSFSFGSTPSFSAISSTEISIGSDSTGLSASILSSVSVSIPTNPIDLSSASGTAFDFSLPSTQIAGLTQVSSTITDGTSKSMLVSPSGTEATPGQLTVSSESSATQENPSPPSSVSIPSGPSETSGENTAATTPIPTPPGQSSTTVVMNTTLTPVLTTATTSTTTTNPAIIVLAQPISVDYTITQTVNPGFNLTTPDGQKGLIDKIKADLRPELVDVVYNAYNCSGTTCLISYNVSYRGFGNPDRDRIAQYIADRTHSYASAPIVTPINNVSCLNQQMNRRQDVCFYCGTESPCAELPESQCMLPADNSYNYFCQCDRSKYFFRTNYEYDEKCGRSAILWWPQMLAICLLIFLILLLLCLILMLCRRRRRRISKKLKREPQVLSNAPQKTSDFEYVELNNLNQTSTYPNIRRPPPIYSVDRSNDYVYRQRIPENYTYPSRASPYVQKGFLPNDFYNVENGTNRDFNVNGDMNDNDDEIFV